MTEEKRISRVVQDYLKTIYLLTRDGEPCTTTEIAERLGVAPASVTSMLKKLAVNDPTLVSYRKHHGVLLTEDGKREALHVLRRHRLVEVFLVQTLGYSWDEVHEEAEKLEHVVSAKMEERMAALLGEPEFNPHGEPIPDEDLSMPVRQTIPLNQLQPGTKARICQVFGEDSGFLQYLSELHIKPSKTIELIRRSPYDQTLTLRLLEDQNEIVVGEKLGDKILVQEIKA